MAYTYTQKPHSKVESLSVEFKVKLLFQNICVIPLHQTCSNEVKSVPHKRRNFRKGKCIFSKGKPNLNKYLKPLLKNFKFKNLQCFWILFFLIFFPAEYCPYNIFTFLLFLPNLIILNEFSYLLNTTDVVFITFQSN